MPRYQLGYQQVQAVGEAPNKKEAIDSFYLVVGGEKPKLSQFRKVVSCERIKEPKIQKLVCDICREAFPRKEYVAHVRSHPSL